MNNISRTFAVVCACFIWCSSLAASIESAIDRAEGLMAQEQYDAALRVLEPYAKQGNPIVDHLRAQTRWFRTLHGKKSEDLSQSEVDAALQEAESCASRGNGGCLNLLYAMHSLGAGLPIEMPKAIEYLRKASEAEDPGARLNYAVMSYTGTRYVERDVELACKYFHETLETPGAAVATYYLGVVRFRGQCGTDPDPVEAMKMIREAASRGVMEAQRDVGKDYQFGWSTEADIDKALEWYEKAAAQGDGESLWRLGIAHVDGEGREKNSKVAVDYFKRAADADYGAGMASLAVMFATGDGVECDFAQAKRLYERAGELGEAHAYYGLAVMYARGEGMPVDLIKARTLYAQAVALGDPPNDAFIGHLESRMTAEHIAQAEQAFQAWVLEQEAR
jgi:TPR repeat protein